jgi:hypothetical protein
LLCAVTDSMAVLTGVRFVQSPAIPTLTTCVPAYPARILASEQLNTLYSKTNHAHTSNGLLFPGGSGITR